MPPQSTPSRIGSALALLLGLGLALGACAGPNQNNAFRSVKPSPMGSTHDTPQESGPSTEGAAPRSAGVAPRSEPSHRGRPAPATQDDEGTAKRSVLRRRQPPRSGLATRWGERRHSEVRSASFARANRLHPFSVDKLFYNDRRGIRSMAGRHGYAGRRLFSVGSGYLDVGLQDASGRYLQGFVSGSRNYVQGQQGKRYSIVLRNNSPGRIEVVVSVDGLDVIDGRSGSLNKRGYLIQPQGRLRIDGWRTSENDVATFRFGSPSQSYSARKHGTTRNVGVIGIAFFHERGDAPRFWRNQLPNRPHHRHQANPFPGRFATSP